MPDERPWADAEANEEPPARFADDVFYRALAAQPRRRLLSYLLDREQCSIEELVDVLCGWETTSSRMVDSERAHQVHIELVHNHLPLLEAAGLLQYDPSDGEVVAEPLAAPVGELIRRSVQAETN